MSARIVIVQALAVIACLGFSAVALATHPRPVSATPHAIPLVPAFEECFGANSVHGPPLATASCNPPLQSSSYLTMVAPDRPAPFNGTAVGSAIMEIKATCLNPGTTTPTGQQPPCPNTGDQADIRISLNASDVRCVGAAGQGSCVSGGGSLYNGKLLMDIPVRYTDHHNSTTGQSCAATTSCPATTDVPTNPAWPIGVQCTSGACNYVTSVDLAMPGTVLEVKRAVIEMGAVEIRDGGLNGQLAPVTSPGSGVCPPACQDDSDTSTTYLSQGLLAP